METQYEILVENIAKTMNLTKAEKNKLLKNKAARLVASTPYLAEADDVERKAATRLLIFVAGSMHGRKLHVYNCRPKDTLNKLWQRIDYICPCDPTGDYHIINAARYRLMYLQLADFKRDLDDDSGKGKYNPFADHASICDMDELYNDVIKHQTINDKIDTILPIEDARAGWWW